MPANFENLAVTTGLESQFSFQSQRRAMPKNVQITTQLHSSHMLAQNSLRDDSTVHELWTSRCSSWIFKRLKNQISNCQHLLDQKKKQENSRKISTTALLTTPKPFTVWITANYGKFFKRWEYQTPWPVSWEICMQVKKQQLELDMEQQTGSKSGKEYSTLYIVTLLI